jgi:hypothetical protein
MNDQTSDKPDKLRPMDTTARQPDRRGRPNSGLGRDVQAKIGQQLRAYYDGLIEPTPDKFADLLRQLDNKSTGNKGSAE